MNFKNWFRSRKARLRDRRQRRFQSAWRLAFDAVSVTIRSGENRAEAITHQAMQRVRTYEFGGVMSSLIIALAIELIPFLVKLIVNAFFNSNFQKRIELEHIDQEQLKNWCAEIGQQISWQLRSTDDSHAISASVPQGSIPEVLSALSELFEVLAKLWGLLSQDDE